MRFNSEKFKKDTNGSGRYADWSESLINVLESAGCSRPSYDFHEHIFSLQIERPPTKTGRHRQETRVNIVCPDNGEIKVMPYHNLKLEEIGIAIEVAVRFLVIMANAGYILL